MILSDEIHRLIKKSGRKKKEIALSIGFTYGYIQNLEGGHAKKPTFEFCKKFLDAVGATDQERHEFLLCALNDRFTDEHKLFIEELNKKGEKFNTSFLFNLLDRDDAKSVIQEVLKDRFGTSLNKDTVELLSTPEGQGIVEMYKSVPEGKREDFLNACRAMLKMFGG